MPPAPSYRPRRLLARVCVAAMLLIPARAFAGYGLAMVGTPKYGLDAPHLSYVNPDAPKSGALHMAANGTTFDTLNPFTLKGTPAKGLELVYDRLMVRVADEPFTLYPEIAASVDVPDDRSNITFHLNPRARFQDGSTVTADDILFSWQTLRDHGPANMRRVYKLAAKAERLDARTIRFTFGPGSDRETPMIFALMPVLSKAWWQGRDFDAGVTTPPLGNGPYRIESVDFGRQVVLARNPDWWARDLPLNRGLYNFDRIVYDYYRDDTVAFEAFKAGDLDLRREFDAARWVSAYDFPLLQQGRIIAEALPHHRPEPLNALIFNTRRPPFDDIRVREALEDAFDFDWMNRTLFRNRYKRIESTFPNSALAPNGRPDAAELALLNPLRATLPPDVFGQPWHAPDTSTSALWRQSLEHADALLRQAGWVVRNGIRVRADNPSQTFHFEILITAPEDEKVALAFLRGLERLGINATVRRLDTAAFTQRLKGYDYDMVLDFWRNTLSPGSEQVAYWSCNAAKTPDRFNYAGVCSPAIDALARAVPDARSEAELTARAHALDRAVMWGDYFIPLYYAGEDFVAYKKGLRHPANEPLYGTVLESWWRGKP